MGRHRIEVACHIAGRYQLKYLSYMPHRFQCVEIFFDFLPTFVLFPYRERSMNRDWDKLDRNRLDSVTKLNFNVKCIRINKSNKEM